MTFGQQEASKLRVNKAVSPVVAMFGLGGSEIVLILALILMLLGPRSIIPPMAESLKDGIEQFRRSQRQPDHELRFDKN